MNWRLLSRKEIAWNRKARQRRKNQRRQRQRRESVIASLADASLVASGAVLGDIESTEFLCSPNLRAPKALARRARLMAVAVRRRAISYVSSGRSVPRPRRCLQRSRRSKIQSPAVTPASDTAYVGLDLAIVRAKKMAHHGRSSMAILRYFCRPEVTGLDLEKGIQVAIKHGIIAGSIHSSVLEKLKRTAHFETRLADAHTLYRAMIQTGVVPPVAGEWAYFPVTYLTLALPGIKLPRALRRDEFFVRIFRNKKGRIICLDLHSIRFKGLCRHPLPQPPRR